MTIEEADKVLEEAVDMHHAAVKHLRSAQALERLASDLLLRAITNRKVAEGEKPSNVIELNWRVCRDLEG